MPELEVTCPSGLAGVVRGWKTKEANILANRKFNREGTAFDRMLAACWLSTRDVGPYESPNGKPLDWSKVLLCDRFWALLQIRAATYGDEYAFQIQCEDRRSCGKRIEWEINLSELPFKTLPEETSERIKAGENKFEVELAFGEFAGRKVYFKLLTGTGERAAQKLMENQDTRVMVAALAARIIEVEGVERLDLMRFLDELELADLATLMDAFDEADGGVETSIEIECPHCGLLQDVELPLDRPFFLPRSRKVRPQTLST